MMFTKCKVAKRRVKFTGNSAVEKKLKKCNQFSLGKLQAGKLVCKFHTTTKRRETEPRFVASVVSSLSILRQACLSETLE